MIWVVERRPLGGLEWSFFLVPSGAQKEAEEYAFDRRESPHFEYRAVEYGPKAEEPEELDIEDVPRPIELLRARFLFELEANSLDAEAEQHFLLALSALEQAHRFAQLAVYKTRQMRAATKGSYG